MLTPHLSSSRDLFLAADDYFPGMPVVYLVFANGVQSIWGGTISDWTPQFSAWSRCRRGTAVTMPQTELLSGSKYRAWYNEHKPVSYISKCLPFSCTKLIGLLFALGTGLMPNHAKFIVVYAEEEYLEGNTNKQKRRNHRDTGLDSVSLEIS